MDYVKLIWAVLLDFIAAFDVIDYIIVIAWMKSYHSMTNIFQ